MFVCHYFPSENSLLYVYRNLRPSHISAISSFGHCRSRLLWPGVFVAGGHSTATTCAAVLNNLRTTSCTVPALAAQHTQQLSHSYSLSTTLRVVQCDDTQVTRTKYVRVRPQSLFSLFGCWTWYSDAVSWRTVQKRAGLKPVWDVSYFKKTSWEEEE